jgi:hypothetical protein
VNASAAQWRDPGKITRNRARRHRLNSNPVAALFRWRDGFVPDAYIDFTIKPDATVEDFKMSSASTLADFSFDFQDLVFVPILGSAAR